jgi:TolA-binding protein
LGKFYQSQAQETLRARDYQIAASKYQEYLDKFPKAENAAEIHYYFAECAYEQGDFTAAADAYHAIVIKYDSTKYREDAAYNRILCYYQLLGTDKTIDSVTVYIEEFLGTGDILTAKLNKQSQVDILHACNDFVRFFSSSKYSDQVLMKFAETLHELELFYPAVKAYKKVVDLGPSSSYYLSAIMNTGQSLFEGQYYDEAELWLKNLVKNYPDSTRYVNRAKRLIASSQFKIAERKSQSGQSEEAAAILQTIATENNESQFKERALYAAANEYQKIGKNTQAALAFEELADSHPESELADEALYQAATLRENNQEWTLAAANYVKLEENFPESNYAAQSLKNAALCYENQKEWFAAKKLYTKFTNKYSHETQDMIECLFKSGEMAYKTNNFDQALSSFHQTIDFYRSEISNGKLLDNYFVANAQFMIGEIYFQDYQTLDLKPPLKQNLRRKIDKLNLVLNNYKETLEYQVADWSTAASYKIGRAFEELVRAFMESPPPPGLEQQQVKLYTEKLEQSAIPHKESALKAYIQNIKKAKQNQIENVWIAQSRERMQILMDELGYNEKTKSALEKSGASDS